ncbi:protein MNN4-like isoform X2 [Miscanthus floridulus]|uniref:protein MNN4-like isoform X2 n=1 Tax=Miscanthus floridulus TaxID=154761 RepID=UPI00345A1A71
MVPAAVGARLACSGGVRKSLPVVEAGGGERPLHTAVNYRWSDGRHGCHGGLEVGIDLLMGVFWKLLNSWKQGTHLLNLWPFALYAYFPNHHIIEKWINTEIKPEDKEWMQKLLRWEAEDKEVMEKRRREEAVKKEHKEEEERRHVAAYREEREKKLERARRAKTAMEENPNALRMRKWPRCTQ